MKRTPIIATLVLLFSLFTGFAYAEPAVVNINTADVAARPKPLWPTVRQTAPSSPRKNWPMSKVLAAAPSKKMRTGLPSSDPGRRGLSPPPTGFAPESYPEPEMSSGQAKRRGLS